MLRKIVTRTLVLAGGVYAVDKFSRRKISITVQLSDPSEYEGGDLQIKINAGQSDTPKGLGNVVIFPSYLLHRVTPVTKGLRRSLVLWITGPAFK